MMLTIYRPDTVLNAIYIYIYAFNSHKPYEVDITVVISACENRYR